tara:strand:+ start:288 stop:434 length:147 start_codon:yes stop_codon:yes gene_type:complete
MNILITGHSGFIGKNLIEKIINVKDYNLLLISKNKKKITKIVNIFLQI